MNEKLGKEVPVPGTYHSVPANPQRLRDVLMAPIAGMYDPKNEKSRAIDVALFVLVIGGFLGVVTKTGAIDAGIGRVTAALRGREIWDDSNSDGVVCPGRHNVRDGRRNPWRSMR